MFQFFQLFVFLGECKIYLNYKNPFFDFRSYLIDSIVSIMKTNNVLTLR